MYHENRRETASHATAAAASSAVPGRPGTVPADRDRAVAAWIEAQLFRLNGYRGVAAAGRGETSPATWTQRMQWGLLNRRLFPYLRMSAGKLDSHQCRKQAGKLLLPGEPCKFLSCCGDTKAFGRLKCQPINEGIKLAPGGLHFAAKNVRTDRAYSLKHLNKPMFLGRIAAGPFAQLSALARIRAVVVLPTPRAPEKMYACATRPDCTAFASVRVTCDCPTTSAKVCGRHFRAIT